MSKPKAANGLARHGTYVTSLSLRDVRCFSEAQTLSLADEAGSPARWTIILGENGVGKTTLLQVLAMACGARYERYIYESWREYEEGPRPPLDFARGREERGFVHAMLSTATGSRQVEFTIAGDAPRPEWAEVPRPLVCGYGAGRRIGATRFSRRHRHSKVKYGSLFVDAPLVNAEEWLLGEDYAAAKEGKAGGPAARRLERLKELLTRILPEVDDVRVGEPRRHWEPSVEFKTPYGWVALDALSLGYQSLIAWMVDLAASMFDRHEKHREPLAEPAVVLVDEIDLHLHPKWQRDIIAFLTERFPNAQFVATAHSPLVVQAAEDANVVLLKRDGDHVVIENNPADVRSWRIDQILTSDLYGLPTARPPWLDELIAERRSILTKATLSVSDQRRLRLLENRIGELPGGESPEEQRAMSLILRAAKGLPKRPARKPR
ncbi:MAG: AAA family ATPase [Labilithrix sp.]|nr:AAA family ATPase [Labilithrix sp.]